MIQRIQSVYFLLAGLFPALLFFTSLLTFECEGKVYFLSAVSFGISGQPALHTPYGVIVFAILCVVLPILAIFKYSNRSLQIKLAKYTLLLQMLLAVTFAVYIWTFIGGFSGVANFTPGIGLLFWILAVIFTILAKKAVKHDEDLVRAADRIR
jgi:hypothetical protein